MTIGPVPLCYTCRHRRELGERGEWKCDAFPERIPFEIISWQADHHLPFPGDNGIQYEEGEPE